MAIEKLDERKKWLHLSREGSAIAPSGNTLILTWTPGKQLRLTEVMLEAPRQARFTVTAVGGTGKIKRYRLQTAGMLLDARSFEDPIMWCDAGRALEIRTGLGISGLAGEIFSASINAWKLKE